MGSRFVEEVTGLEIINERSFLKRLDMTAVCKKSATRSSMKATVRMLTGEEYGQIIHP